MRISYFNTSSAIVIAIITVIFYTIFVLLSDIEQFSYQWININLLYLPLILAVHFIALSIRGVRQKLFLNSLGIRISLKNNIVLHFAGLSLGMSPFGSGELIKTHFLKRHYGQPFTKTIPIILIEKYHDLLVVVSIISALLLFKNSLESQIVAIMASVFLLALFLIVKSRKMFQTVLSKIPKIWIFKNLSEDAINSHTILCILLRKKTILLGWGIGIVGGIIDACTIYLGFLSFGIDYSFIDSTLLVYTAIIIGSVSFLPGGVGVTDVGMLGLMVKSGIILSTASALTLFIRLTTSWFSVIIGIVALKFVIHFSPEYKL